MSNAVTAVLVPYFPIYISARYDSQSPHDIADRISIAFLGRFGRFGRFARCALRVKHCSCTLEICSDIDGRDLPSE